MYACVTLPLLTVPTRRALLCWMLRSQHDIGGGGAAGIDILKSARPVGERPLFDPIERPEPAGGNGLERFAKLQRRITIGAGDDDLLQGDFADVETLRARQ